MEYRKWFITRTSTTNLCYKMFELTPHCTLVNTLIVQNNP